LAEGDEQGSGTGVVLGDGIEVLVEHRFEAGPVAVGGEGRSGKEERKYEAHGF
jgi:hypothetical protein